MTAIQQPLSTQTMERSAPLGDRHRPSGPALALIEADTRAAHDPLQTVATTYHGRRAIHAWLSAGPPRPGGASGNGNGACDAGHSPARPDNSARSPTRVPVLFDKILRAGEG